MMTAHKPTRSNQFFACLTEDDRANMIAEAALHYEKFLRALGVDVEHDHNSKDTAHRVSRMYVEELMAGRFTAPPKLTDFDNVAKHNNLIMVGPITVRSMCSHHQLPIQGYAYIGVYPGDELGKFRLPGLSKYARLVEYWSARPQIQEELVEQIKLAIADATQAAGVAVIVEAKHQCMAHRGVKSENAVMRTTALHGEMIESADLKTEFTDFVSSVRIAP